MPDTFDLVVVLVTFLLAGLVKGVIGLGLPTISLGILTVALGLGPAMALMVVPSFITNFWQATSGGHLTTVLTRTWLFLLVATLAVAPGLALMANVATDRLAMLLGLLLACYAVFGLTRPHFSVPARAERWAGPLAGLLNGLFTGLTGSSVVPGVPYLQAIGLPRDQLVQGMGVLFALSAAALAIGLGVSGRTTPGLSLLSVLAVLPALVGMRLGQALRGRLSEAGFRTLFFRSLLALGLYLVVQGAF